MQPGDKGVLRSWGQSQLPQLMLLDVLMAPTISAHLGGAACLCLVQAGLQTMRGAQGHADLALYASFPCCHACTLSICCASAFFLCSCRAAGLTQYDGIRCSPSSHFCAKDMLACTGMVPGQCVLICRTGKKNPLCRCSGAKIILAAVLLC